MPPSLILLLHYLAKTKGSGRNNQTPWLLLNKLSINNQKLITFSRLYTVSK